MASFKDLSGQRFGRLTVMGVDHKRNDGKRDRYFWLCKCDCGEFHIVRTDGLTSGNVKSCGCLHKETAIENVSKHHKHKMSGTSIYKTWQGMKARCNKVSNKSYSRYGGRGITICDEWLNDFQSFYDYVSKLPHFEEDGYTLDRIDNNRGYEPDNVRWADVSTQNRNRRSNVVVNYAGENMTVTDAARKSGLAMSCLLGRVQRGDKGERLFRPSGDNSKYFAEIDGEKYTFKEIAEISGLSLGAIYQRYRAGKRDKELFKSSQHRGNQPNCERSVDTVERRA